LNATLKQWRLAVLWRRTIRDSTIVEVKVDMDSTAAESVFVDTTADLCWQSEQWRIDGVLSGTRIDSVSNVSMVPQREG
jgi:chaperone required for assembly of F1-ATPase